MGRPTKYAASCCDEVRRLGAEGKSRVQIAQALGVSRPTLAEWAKRHTPFARALDEARDLAQAWWEDIGQRAVQGQIKDFAGAPFIFQMKNRFPAEYRDRQEIDARVRLSHEDALDKLA